MKITIRNRIKIDGQEDFVKESYEVELKKARGKTALIYKNAEQEKVLIKFDQQQMSMTRFSNQPVTMRFQKETRSDTFYENIGKLSVLTDEFLVDDERKKIKINYRIVQKKTEIGSYRLQIEWADDKTR